MFEGIVGRVGELRTDISTSIVYRYNGTEWIVNGTGTPSSASFPTTNVEVGEVREDLLTGGKYFWDGSSWVAIVNNDADGDGIPTTVEDGGITTAKLGALSVTAAKLAADAVETAKIKDLNVTTAKIAAGAVTLAKTGITISDVTVALGETTGTATVPAGSVVLSIVPVSNQDQLVDSVLVSDTTLTVTLGAAATADNVFKVVTIV